MRRREEVLERVRRVPAAIPIEADAEREEVERDGEPEKAVRGLEAGVLTEFGGDDGGYGQGVHTLTARCTHALRARATRRIGSLEWSLIDPVQHDGRAGDC